MRKKLLVALLAVVMLLSLTACSGGEIDMSKVKAKSLMGSSEATIRWRFGTSTAPPPGHYVSGLVKFQELIEEYTNGQMTIDIYPQSTIGGERDMIEMCGMGILDGLVCATGPVPNFIPNVAITDFPYIFGTAEEAYAMLDGEIGQYLLAQFDELNIVGSGFWENGFRDTTNSKRPIVHPDDLKGLKIRTMENQVHMGTYNLLGATATPMAYGEVFTALNQKTIDGQENPPVIIATDKLYEAQDYLSITHLFYSPSILLYSKKSFNDLPTQELKDAVERAAQEAKDWEREYSQKSSAEGVEEMRAAGIEVNEVDIEEWRAAVQPMYENAGNYISADSVELLAKLQAELEKYRASH